MRTRARRRIINADGTISQVSLNRSRGKVPDWSEGVSLGPIRRRSVPAMALQLFEQACVKRPAVAGGQIGVDVLDLAHAGNDGRDRRLG